MQNFNTNRWEEEQKRNEAFRLAMANGGVQDPAGYQPNQLSKNGRVPLAVGAPGPMQVNPGPWGDAKYAPMTPAAAPAIQNATPPMGEGLPAQDDGRAPAPSNPAPLAPSPREDTASPPMDRPTGGPLKKDKKQATQANGKANAAFRSYMQMFNSQGR